MFLALFNFDVSFYKTNHCIKKYNEVIIKTIYLRYNVIT